MATSYPDRTNARGIWNVNQISKNLLNEGTFPQGSTRGIFTISSSFAVTVEYITLEVPGNSADFGDLSVGRSQLASLGNFTRSIVAGGTVDVSDTLSNVMDYVSFLTLGNHADFGDLLAAKRLLGASGNTTRGVLAGGISSNVIEYMAFASTGNSVDFGDLTVAGAGYQNSQCNSPTRGLFSGSNTPGPATNVIDFIQFSTTGNGVDFGDLTVSRSQPAGVCSSTRGIWAGGTASTHDEIDVLTIGS